MLLRISLLVALISVVRGNPPLEHSKNEGRGGMLIWEWDKIFKTKGSGSGGSGDYTGGNVTIGEEGGDFFNAEPEEGSPGPRVQGVINQDTTRQVEEDDKQYGTVKAILNPPEDAVQLKITINNLYLYGPEEGDCVNDTLVIMGANPGLEIPVLCGRIIDPQILYIDICNSEGPFEIVITYLMGVPYPLEWNIHVSYLKEAEAVERRCLQYYTEPSGTIRSFNYDGDAPQMINDQTYSICFGYVSGYCEVAFNFERFDLGRLSKPCGSDYLRIGDDKYCEDSIDRSIIVNATGPINLSVRSGPTNDIEEEGFKASYMMVYCGPSLT